MVASFDQGLEAGIVAPLDQEMAARMVAPHDQEMDACMVAPLSHGMDAGMVAPDWPPLTLAEVEALAPRYAALAGPLRLAWHSPRPFSAAARVQTAQGEVFIKRHDLRVRDVAALREEHAFIAHLRTRGMGVPEVLSNRENMTATVLGARCYEVHALVRGEDAYRDVHSWVPAQSTADARSMGAALAHLHAAARGFHAPPRPPRPLLAGIDIVGAADLAESLERFVARRPAVAGFLAHEGITRSRLCDAMSPWHRRLRPLLPALEDLWVHNDWHGSNLFWDGPPGARRVSAAIDFGLSNVGWAVADLATALERNTIAWLEPGEASGRIPLALALVDGYCAVRPLTAAERLALPLVLPLAHVEYALSEVDYFHRIVGNDGNARLACPKFLLGHMAWFGGEQGGAYLGAVRAHLDAAALTPGPSPAGGRGEEHHGG
jgi:Ser/Thr protein kinase RdoA (MazF antagonist)